MRSTPLAILVLVAIAAFLGCDGDSPQSVVLESNGSITGLVRGPDGPIGGIEVTARPLRPESDERIPRTATGHDGGFTFSLPPDSYLLNIRLPHYPTRIWYGADSLSLSPRGADTLQVYADPDPVHAEFLLGSLNVRLLVPREMRRGLFFLWAETDGGATRLIERAGPGEAKLSFMALAPGKYRLRLFHQDPEGNVSGVFLPPTYDPGEADAVVVAANGVTEWRGALPTPGRLRGRVLGSWRETAARPPLIQASGETPVAYHRADAQGFFEVPIYASGKVPVSARIDDATFYFGPGTPEFPTEFEVGPGREVDAGTVTVGGIRIHLAGRATLRPFAPHIWVHDETGRTVRSQAILEDRDLVTISGLGPGTYFLEIAQSIGAPWRPQWYDHATRFEDARPLLIEPDGRLVEIDVTLEEGGVIEGRVLDPDGNLVPQVRIEAEAVESELRILPEVTSDADGSFRIEGLPDDEIRLWAFAPGYAATYYPGTTSLTEAEAITIRHAERVRRIEWRLIRE